MQPDVEVALEYWNLINSFPYSWAVFESVQFNINRITRVQYGSYLPDGTKEMAIGTKIFTLRDDKVDITTLVHL